MARSAGHVQTFGLQEQGSDGIGICNCDALASIVVWIDDLCQAQVPCGARTSSSASAKGRRHHGRFQFSALFDWYSTHLEEYYYLTPCCDSIATIAGLFLFLHYIKPGGPPRQGMLQLLWLRQARIVIPVVQTWPLSPVQS